MVKLIHERLSASCHSVGAVSAVDGGQGYFLAAGGMLEKISQRAESHAQWPGLSVAVSALAFSVLLDQ